MKQFMKNRKAIALVLLIAMLFSILPTAVWADTDSIPFTAEADGKIIEVKLSVENYVPIAWDGSEGEAVKLYVIEVPSDTENIVFRFGETKVLAYGYSNVHKYVASYGNSDDYWKTGDVIATVSKDTFAEYVRIQEPYYDGYNSQLLYAIHILKETSNTELPAEEISIDKLLENIAAGYVDDASEWVVLDMAAYEDLNPDSENVTSDSAKQTYINNAIASITDSATGETAYSKAILSLTALGIDPTQLYPVNSNTIVSAVAKLNALSAHSSSAWVAPYTFAAWQQGAYATETQELALINSVLANQNTDGSWSEWDESIQATANMIAGLSFYYNDNKDVKVAVDKAITYLSSVQKNDGSFDAYGDGSDANTSAMVVIALASVGINPETDTRFIKNDVSALDSLLCFALADNSGFGYQNNTSLNPYATEQGFRALIAASQVMKTGGAFNVYDFSGNTLEPGRATGAGEVVTPSRPNTDSTIDVTLSIKGVDGYWLKNKSVTLKEGSTMYYALVDGIDGTGITQTGAENGYVSAMSKNGTTLAEFDYGRNSGWLYKVNNTLPEVGLLEYVVQDGDAIEWYYTEDWTKDSLAGSRVDNSDREAAGSVDDLIGAIDLENIDKNSEAAIKAAREAYDALTDEQKALVENYDDLVAAEALFAALPTELPFEDTQNHWAKDAIQYVYDNGLMRGVSDTDFAPEATFNRAMIASVLHRMAGSPSHSWGNPFRDVSDTAWYAGPVAWAYQNKLAGGISATQYAPESPVTREQLAVMLMRFAQYQGYDTSDTIRLVHYKDAAQVSDYAESAMKWAVSIGLIGGRTNDTLAPQGTATRAEVAVILERFITKFASAENTAQ